MLLLLTGSGRRGSDVVWSSVSIMQQTADGEAGTGTVAAAAPGLGQLVIQLVLSVSGLLKGAFPLGCLLLCRKDGCQQLVLELSMKVMQTRPVSA